MHNSRHVTSSNPESTMVSARTSWEEVAACIQEAPDERDALAALDKYLKAERKTSDDDPVPLAVDSFGCPDTGTWAALVAHEQRYVELCAQRERLQPRVARLQTRLAFIKRPLAHILECAGEGDGSLLLLLLLVILALPLSPAFLYQWYTACSLRALEAEQKKAFEMLDELGVRLASVPCSTLLHVAVKTDIATRSRKKVIKALLQHGASLELVDSNGCDAHALSRELQGISAQVGSCESGTATAEAILDAEAERRRRLTPVVPFDAAGAATDDSCVARDSNGNYRKGTITALAPDQATCTIEFEAGQQDTRTCATAHLLTCHQWRVYQNRSGNLLRHALSLRGLLSQVPRYGATPGERRQRFRELIHEQSHLLPMMSVIKFKTLEDRLEKGGSIPHSKEMVTVPVTSIPAASRVVFFSHTRLQERAPDNKHNVKLSGLVEAMEMFARESEIETDLVYAWVDEACIDQETWSSKHPDIGMSFVYALPIYVACSDYFVYCRWDRNSRKTGHLRYENRAWCRVELLVALNVRKPPMSTSTRLFERYRLSLSVKDDPDRVEGVMVDDLDGVKIAREVMPANRCPVPHPGEGVLSVESDRAPLVLIAHMLGYERGCEHEGIQQDIDDSSSDANAEAGEGRESISEPVQRRAKRKMSRSVSAFELSEAMALDPASVVDHERRQAPWTDLLYEVLLSYRDVLIVAVVMAIPATLYIYVLARSGPYLKGGAALAPLYSNRSFPNYTNSSTTLSVMLDSCPEMDGFDARRGATLNSDQLVWSTFSTWGCFNSIAQNSLALISRGFGYQTPRFIKGALAGTGSTLLAMLIVLLSFQDDVFRFAGDLVACFMGHMAIVGCNIFFVGQRKVNTAVVPASPQEARSGKTGAVGTTDVCSKPEEKAVTNRLVLISNVISLIYCLLYAFQIIPLFQTLTSEGRLLFRIIVHPLVVLTGEMLLREVAAAPSDKPPLINCCNIINFDMYFQLVGRFVVAAQTDETLTNITVIVIGLQELIARMMYLPQKRWLRRNVYRLPPMTAEAEGRFLGVLAIDNMSSMQSEVSAILIAAAAKLLLYDERVNFNLGFEINTRPRLDFELQAMALSVVVSSVGNIIAMVVQQRQGVSHVSMVRGERWKETMIMLVSTSMAMTCTVMYTFALRNVSWYCPGEQGGGFCGCTFTRTTQVLSAFCCTGGKEEGT